LHAGIKNGRINKMEPIKFINCKIDFSKKVFRPRPETEFWVGQVLKEIKKQAKRGKIFEVLDIFAGTGCIGLAVLKNTNNLRVDFADIWALAVLQIKINLKLNKISENRYKVYKSDLFEKLKNKRYDFIFANPPYVALDRISEVQKEVLKNDPLVALFSGRDGMIIIENLFRQVGGHLKQGGKIFLEFDPLQKGKIQKIAKQEKFEVVFKKDQFCKVRWLEAVKI
jgi:release factor glutamine methyltransferase